MALLLTIMRCSRAAVLAAGSLRRRRRSPPSVRASHVGHKHLRGLPKAGADELRLEHPGPSAIGTSGPLAHVEPDVGVTHRQHPDLRPGAISWARALRLAIAGFSQAAARSP